MNSINDQCKGFLFEVTLFGFSGPQIAAFWHTFSKRYFPTVRLPLARLCVLLPRRANVDTMCILLYQDVTMQKGLCSPFFRRYYGRVGLLLHLHPVSTHAATGYWPYDMLTNIPMFSKDRLSTLPRLDQSLRKCILLFTLSMRPSGGRCAVMNASIWQYYGI